MLVKVGAAVGGRVGMELILAYPSLRHGTTTEKPAEVEAESGKVPVNP